jgi:hypothetical protein
MLVMGVAMPQSSTTIRAYVTVRGKRMYYRGPGKRRTSDYQQAPQWKDTPSQRRRLEGLGLHIEIAEEVRV